MNVNLFSNPEILRNARMQLRPRKMLIAAAIAAAISLAIGYAFFESDAGLAGRDGYSLLYVIVMIQAFVLVIGGGIACLHSVQREKDQNTFDFQRITRLTPFELTLGKLFGSALMPAFVFLWFIPAAVAGAVAAGTPWTIFLAAYGLLILGAIVYCAFALVISLFLRRGAVTWALLFFLAFVGYTSSESWLPYLAIGALSPFTAAALVRQGSWSLGSKVIHVAGNVFIPPNPFHDIFFGMTVHHVLVLFILYVTLLAWLIPAIARNIKRDPGNYELYAPAQALGFLFYLNFILFAFFRWNFSFASYASAPRMSFSPLESQSSLLGVNIVLFFVFGFVLLRNRNQIRRRLRNANSGSGGWLEFWPAPYLFIGALIVGAAMVTVIQWKHNPSLEWSLTIGIFRVIFFAFWLICDFLFLQWMKLQRSGHPLLMGVLYLAVYYACAGIVVGSLHLGHNPFAAIFLPTPLFVLNTALWTAHQPVWFLALALQIVAGMVFVVLQRRRLAALRDHTSATLTSASATASLS